MMNPEANSSSASSTSSSSAAEKVGAGHNKKPDLNLTNNNEEDEEGLKNRIDNNDGDPDYNIKIPIVGFETMEERARFTVFKLRVENQRLGESYLIFRRYTDFVRLHSKLKEEFPQINIPLPPKRWLRDNFETAFLEDRSKGLQALVDSIFLQPRLIECFIVREFFCLDEPPAYYDNNAEESRSISGNLEENTNLQMKHRIADKEQEIQLLKTELALVITQRESVICQRDGLLKIMKNCKSCQLNNGRLSMPSTSSSSSCMITPSPVSTSTPAPAHRGGRLSNNYQQQQNQNISPKNSTIKSDSSGSFDVKQIVSNVQSSAESQERKESSASSSFLIDSPISHQENKKHHENNDNDQLGTTNSTDSNPAISSMLTNLNSESILAQDAGLGNRLDSSYFSNSPEISSEKSELNRGMILTKTLDEDLNSTENEIEIESEVQNINL